MGRIQRTTTIDATPDEVWAVYANYGAVADWHPYFERAELVPGPADGVGAARDCHFGPRQSIRETVRSWDDGQRMVIDIEFIKGPPMPIRDLVAAVDVAGGRDGATELALTLDYETRWGPVGLVADRLFVRSMYTEVFDNMLAATKQFVEDGTTVEPLAIPLSGRKI